jgi:chaperonin GroEL
LRFDDERQDALADAFEECARRQDKDAGDGTTTATLMLCSGVPLALKDVSPIETPIPGAKTVMQIKEQLEEEAKVAVKMLEKHAIVPDEGDATLAALKLVAHTAMEGHECSDLIAETVFEVGHNSNTNLAEGFDETVKKEVTPGIEMPLKIQTPSMFTNPNRKEAMYENAIVVVANHVFESYSDLSNLMNTMMAHKKQHGEGPQPIVIVGKQFSIPFTSQIVAVTKQIGIPILLLDAGALKDEEFQDIAEYTNAQYFDTHPKEGNKMSDFGYSHCGRTKKIIAGPKQTSFIGGEGLTTTMALAPDSDEFVSRVEARIKDLKKLADDEQNPEYREELKRRAAGLGGGVATIYVDAKTAVDRYYLKKKVEDAVNSCKAVYEGGIVPGGGRALLEVANELRGTGKADYLPGMLESVYKRVQMNAGGELEIGEEVMDAFWTNKCAIENATAVLKILVTTEGVIVDRERDLGDELNKLMGYEG